MFSQDTILHIQEKDIEALFAKFLVSTKLIISKTSIFQKSGSPNDVGNVLAQDFVVEIDPSIYEILSHVQDSWTHVFTGDRSKIPPISRSFGQ